MLFSVKLIEVNETSNQAARDDLQESCTHVANSYWLFEGDEFALHDGISFDIVKEVAISGYGELSGSKLKSMVIETYDVDKCFFK